jgi:hypothetical protein
MVVLVIICFMLAYAWLLAYHLYYLFVFVEGLG